jgi:hypothetical protein
MWGYSDCKYCTHYNKYRNCNRRERVEIILFGEIKDSTIVDQFLCGKRKVKTLVNGKKEVECPCYKFDSEKCLEGL